MGGLCGAAMAGPAQSIATAASPVIDFNVLSLRLLPLSLEPRYHRFLRKDREKSPIETVIDTVS
jgi:hypothetical protein